MSTACAHWRGDLGAYIVGVLDDDARSNVRTHLEKCGACRAEFDELIEVRDWLGRLALPDGIAAVGVPVGEVSADMVAAGRTPGGPAPEPILPRHRGRQRWFACAAAAIVAAAGLAFAVVAHSGDTTFSASDRVTGVHGEAHLRGTGTGTQIDLTVTGLPAGQLCTLNAVSRAGTDVAGTWTASYAGTAHIAGTSAFPRSQLTALRVESGTHRVLLIIHV